jgi:hypothetical protein
VLPAETVKSTLGLIGNLTAKPNTEGGNGCDYKLDGAVSTTVIADASDDTGIVGMMFTKRVKDPGVGGQAVAGVGDTAYYMYQGGQNIPKDMTQSYTRQSLVLRAKGKIVSFIITTPQKGLPKDAVLALGKLTAAKAIDTLKESQ